MKIVKMIYTFLKISFSKIHFKKHCVLSIQFSNNSILGNVISDVTSAFTESKMKIVKNRLYGFRDFIFKDSFENIVGLWSAHTYWIEFLFFHPSKIKIQIRKMIFVF